MGSPDVRCAAIKALSRLAKKGDRHAINGLTSRLEDEDWQVRYVAVNALPKIVEPEDHRVIHEVTALLKDESSIVVLAAKEVLHEIAESDYPLSESTMAMVMAIGRNRRRKS